ncbi:hypothetical protein IC614_10195 [Allosphingosinicella flava]|uniref:Uncharacterized protein n=1 Tax=Allosphingosinicella flava TaxID=2771430 RepID=A0A7T2GIV7_9SPHN|nr:hypothetical protein [Sphingosinicella flava]QPQ54688.1 hypothetical protein IC614_10195 [Sphingosinicella flava]
MSNERPSVIAIECDDHSAQYVGHTAEGQQFFLTTPFEPGEREFLALYIFDADGALADALIDDLGPRESMDLAHRDSLRDQRLASLGEITYGRIEISPFSIDRFGITFGLVPREPEDEEDIWAVEAQPGNYMAFFEPWNSGDYDT